MPAELAGLRVLVIDDQADIRELVENILSICGVEVTAVASAQEARDLLRRARPDVVLCDIAMPGMSGYDVARALRQEPSLGTIYLIAVTGYGRVEDQQQALAAGFDLHLTKPVDIDVLRRVLESITAA